MNLLFTFIFLTGYLIAGQAMARQAGADTLTRPGVMYAKATHLSQHLFNGPRYHIYDRNAETHQFYKSRELLTGSLRYDGRDYGPFPMHYDVNFGFLVIRQPVNGFLVRLDSAKVEKFTLDGDYFEAVLNHPQLKSGIYQTLYDGKTRLICHRKKVRMEKIMDFKVVSIFLNADSYFVLTQGAYKRVKRKKDLYTLFPEHKADIRQHLRRSPLNFKEDIESNLIRTVKMIDSPKPAR